MNKNNVRSKRNKRGKYDDNWSNGSKEDDDDKE